MIQFYLKKIKDGTITLENVPLLWKEQVEKELGEEENNEKD